MRKLASILALTTILIGCTPQTTSEIVSYATDAVVMIGVVQKDANNNITGGGKGTGFITGKNWIITNHHVIDGGDKAGNEIFVMTNDSAIRYPARIVAADPVADIAIIELKDWELFVNNEEPKTLVFADSDNVRLGDKVIVIGHPWDLDWTVSEGIVSGKNRRPTPLPKYLYQVDANMFQGNSGGPVLNADGEVVCVSEIMQPGPGGSYGLCVPSNLVNKAINDLIKFKEVRWRTLNVEIGLTDDGSRVKIVSVMPDGAAEKAGIQAGDIILELHTPVNHPTGTDIRTPDQLLSDMADVPGDEEKVKMLIDRKGEKMMIDIVTNYRNQEHFTEALQMLK